MQRWCCLAALLLLVPSLGMAGDGAVSVKECSGMKIGVLDLNDLSNTEGRPQKCGIAELEAITVDSLNGIAYLNNTHAFQPTVHWHGTHSAPFFLIQAVKSSHYYTSNLEEADLVIVNDYCYFLTWLAWVHSRGVAVTLGRSDAMKNPGKHLMGAYWAMTQTPAWKKHNGSNFVLYDSHPGYVMGPAARNVKFFRCSTPQMVHVIMDTPMRNVCFHPNSFWNFKKLLITPYVPSPLDLEDSEAYMKLPFVPRKKRTRLAYNRAKCSPYLPPSNWQGKLMRYWFGTMWEDNEDMDVRCTDPELSKEGHIPFQEMFAKMRESIFCPAFAGDSASTRRLSEIFLAGCIPVFLGPPYHSMPFSETVPYKELGVFINITDTSHWMAGKKTEWQLHPTIRPGAEGDGEWWIPDVDVSDVAFNVKTASDVESVLKGIPDGVVDKKLQKVHEYGRRFSFRQELTDPPNAVNSLLAGICMKQKEHPPE